MSRIRFASAAALLGVLILAASPAAAEEPSKVAVKKGGTFEVTLTRSAGTNYDWEATSIDEQLLKYKGKKVVKEAKKPGGVEECVYTFEAKKAGITTLELGLVPATGKKTPDKLARIRVTVTE